MRSPVEKGDRSKGKKEGFFCSVLAARASRFILVNKTSQTTDEARSGYFNIKGILAETARIRRLLSGTLWFVRSREMTLQQKVMWIFG